MNRLERAQQALHNGDRDLALKQLLARWREIPDPTLAAAIDSLAPDGHPWEGEDRLARCWTALGRPMDGVLSRLLATILDLPPSEAGQVLDGLRQWPEDPRIIGTLLAWFRHPPWAGVQGQKPWRRVFRLLDQRPDRRTTSLHDLDPSRYFNGEMRTWIAERLDRTAGRPLPDPLTLPPRECTLLQELMAALAPVPDPIERLWEAVFTSPRSDSARLVLADALSEGGDARGEFITLQIQGPANPRRERDLLDEHGPDWIGPLDGALLTRGRRFVRGFLDAGVIKPRSPALAEAAMGHENWATLTALELRSALTGPRVFDLAHQPATQSLRELRGLLSSEQLVEVLRNPHRKRLHTLGLGSDAWVQTWTVPSGRPGVRLDLRHLEISSAALDLRGWLTKTLGRVPVITLTTPDVPITSLLHLHPTDALAAMADLQPLARDRVELVIAPDKPILRASMDRDEDWALRLQLLRLPRRPTGSHALNALLQSLDPGRLAALRVAERLASQLQGLERFDVELV